MKTDLNFLERGVTLLEILIALAVITILAAVVLPGFGKVRKIQVLKSATENIVSVIEKARSQTLSSLDSSVYGIHFGSSSAVIFMGSSYDPNSGTNEVVGIISPATISGGTLYNGSVYFNRLSGLPSTTGNIIVSVPGMSSKTITISSFGHASSD